ncbi:MAG: STAS/SEC14 domain-containing protein [Planctomycetota bacterium]|nr:STAS/SEC14 domain-containing protein [Planctomycetota bacterium]
MIEQIHDLPIHVLGFTAKGKVTVDDYESVIMPAVEAMFSLHPKIRFLFHLGEEFSGFEAGTLWDDAKLGFQHFTGWERVAVVSDEEWIRGGVRLVGLLIPGEFRVFHNRELSEAILWIGE